VPSQASHIFDSNTIAGVLALRGSQGVHIGTTVPALAVASTGNVGIGTTVPTNAKLDVAGTIVSRATNLSSGSTIDWSTGNVQYTSSNAATFTMSNMVDGGSYTLVVLANASPVQHNFSHTGLTFKFRPANAAPEAGKDAVYSMIRAGDNVYVSWIKGW
jgi:hypothetical protein